MIIDVGLVSHIAISIENLVEKKKEEKKIGKLKTAMKTHPIINCNLEV